MHTFVASETTSEENIGEPFSGTGEASAGGGGERAGEFAGERGVDGGGGDGNLRRFAIVWCALRSIARSGRDTAPAGARFASGGDDAGYMKNCVSSDATLLFRSCASGRELQKPVRSALVGNRGQDEFIRSKVPASIVFSAELRLLEKCRRSYNTI